MTSDEALDAARAKIAKGREASLPRTRDGQTEHKPPNKTELKAAGSKIEAGRALLRDGRGPKGEEVTEAAKPTSSAAQPEGV